MGRYEDWCVPLNTSKGQGILPATIYIAFQVGYDHFDTSQYISSSFHALEIGKKNRQELKMEMLLNYAETLLWMGLWPDESVQNDW